MSKRATTKTFLKTLDKAIEEFEDTVGTKPQYVIMNPDGIALFMDALEESGNIHLDLTEPNIKYRHMHIAICAHENFPLFTLSIGKD